MVDLTNLAADQVTAQQILGIPAEQPEQLFRADDTAIRQRFRLLAKHWHSDHNQAPEAAAVFIHLKKLRDAAFQKLATNSWQTPGFFSFTATNGQSYRAPSLKQHRFDLGTMHIGSSTITYVIGQAYADLFQAALTILPKLTINDQTLQQKYGEFIPTEWRSYTTADSFVLQIRKPSDFVLLADLAPKLPTATKDRHIAWITSRLHETVRLLDYLGIAHHAILADTVWVNPQDHRIALLGGWWYAAPIGAPLHALPEAASELVSTTQPIADGQIDREMIRALARELLGDRRGTKLPLLNAAPEAMVRYLREPSLGEAQKDLTVWKSKILPAAFGPPKFEKLSVTFAELYEAAPS